MSAALAERPASASQHERPRAIVHQTAPGVPGASAAPLPPLVHRAHPRPLRPLTAREEQVCRLLAAGRPIRAIADELGLSRRTVETHLERVSQILPFRGLTPRDRVLVWAFFEYGVGAPRPRSMEGSGS